MEQKMHTDTPEHLLRLQFGLVASASLSTRPTDIGLPFAPGCAVHPAGFTPLNWGFVSDLCTPPSQVPDFLQSRVFIF